MTTGALGEPVVPQTSDGVFGWNRWFESSPRYINEEPRLSGPRFLVHPHQTLSSNIRQIPLRSPPFSSVHLA
jgi:hypothetical protein